MTTRGRPQGCVPCLRVRVRGQQLGSSTCGALFGLTAALPLDGGSPHHPPAMWEKRAPLAAPRVSAYEAPSEKPLMHRRCASTSYCRRGWAEEKAAMGSNGNATTGGGKG